MIPDNTFDVTRGFMVDDIVVHSGGAYLCIDNTPGCAVWKYRSKSIKEDYYFLGVKTHDHTTDDVTDFQTALDTKVDNDRVLTDVPAGALFTDTITTINGKTGVITKTDITDLGIPAQDTVYVHPSTHPDGEVILTETYTGNLTGATTQKDANDILDAMAGGGGKEWQLQFFNQADIIQVEATANNISTFVSGFGTDVGTIEVSNDGVTYSPLVFPFSPSVGTWYFKRSVSLLTGVYTISE